MKLLKWTCSSYEAHKIVNINKVMVSITSYYGSILWTDFGTKLDVSNTVNVNTFNTPNEYIAIVNTEWELNDSISKMRYRSCDVGFLTKHQTKFGFCTMCTCQLAPDSWNPSSWKVRRGGSYIVSTVAADGMAIQRTKTATNKALTFQLWYQCMCARVD